jgi:hypothetical protein
MTFPAAMLALVLGILAGPESVRGSSFLLLDSHEAAPPSLAALSGEAAEDATVAEDPVSDSGGPGAFDPAPAAGRGREGGETAPPSPSYRPCRGFENIEALRAAAASS